MPIIMCIICSCLIWAFAEHKKSSLFQIFLLNVLLTIAVYSYYIGYSATTLKAAFCRVSPNAVYCSVMSVLVAVFLCSLRFYGKHKKIPSDRVDYHIGTMEWKLFCLIVFVAFFVRIIGVNWGAGQTFNPDEGKVVRPPIHMAENCTFMSDELEAPSQITSRVLSITFKPVMVVGDLLGIEIGELIYVIITRVYMAVLSTGVVVSIFLIGNHLKRHAGTVAAVLTAFFPPFVHVAHCAANDTFIGLCISVCILCAFHYLEEDRDFKWLLLMALITVFATFDKWHGIVACAIIVIAVCTKQIKHKKYRNIIIQGAFSLLIILVATVVLVPNLVGNIQGIIKTLMHLTNDYVTESNSTFSENAYAYVSWFFSHMGILSLIFLVAGLLYAVKKKRIEFALLLIGLIEIFGICLQDRHYIRWGYPFYVVLIILVGVGVVYVYEKMYHKSSKIIFGCVITLTGLNLFAGTLLLDVMFTNSKLDTRVISEQWCLAHGIGQFDCLYDAYTCWEPGGMVLRYPYRYGIYVKWAIENQNGNVVTNHIGRKYAVTVPSDDMTQFMEQIGSTEIAHFKAGCLFNDGGFGDFGNVPHKFSTLSRIRFCIEHCVGILQDEIAFGHDIAIYDVSMIPSYEKCECRDYDSMADIYWGMIDKIPKGDIRVEIVGESVKKGSVFIEDVNGVTVAAFDYTDGCAKFSMDKDYYLLTVKTDRKFDYIIFTPDIID